MESFLILSDDYIYNFPLGFSSDRLFRAVLSEVTGEFPSTLDAFLQKFEGALHNIILPDLFLEKYCLMRGVRNSNVFVSDAKSNTSRLTTDSTNPDMSKFRISDMLNRPVLYRWTIDITEMTGAVQANLGIGQQEWLELLEINIRILKDLRSILYKANCLNINITDSIIQRIMNLFLTPIVALKSLNAHAVNSMIIKYQATGADGRQMTWKGSSDIGISSSNQQDISSIARHSVLFEMKRPFDTQSMYHSTATQCKQQTLGQWLGLSQMGMC